MGSLSDFAAGGLNVGFRRGDVGASEKQLILSGVVCWAYGRFETAFITADAALALGG